SSADSVRPNSMAKISRFRLPSVRRRISASMAGRLCFRTNALKAWLCHDMLSTTVPSRSKITARGWNDRNITRSYGSNRLFGRGQVRLPGPDREALAADPHLQIVQRVVERGGGESDQVL